MVPLSLEQKRAVLLRAKEVCSVWWVDILDCRESMSRQRVELSWDEIMGKLDWPHCFTMIPRTFFPENFLEVGFRAMGVDVDYFLFIHVDLRFFDELRGLYEQAAGED